MTKYDPNERPNSSDLFKSKHSWALNDKAFDFRRELEIIKNSSNEESSYVYSIINSKLKHLIEMNAGYEPGSQLIDRVLYELNKYFANDISLSFSSAFEIIIITKYDKVYRFKRMIDLVLIALGDSKIESIIESSIDSILSNEGIIEISCGFSHLIALTYEGKIYCWGDNSYGQLGIESRAVQTDNFYENFGNLVN
jgi:hypothetical protein